MGDWFQIIADKDATEEDAPKLATDIHCWLIAEGIVSADRDDCVLGADGGFSPGPFYGKAVEVEYEHLKELLTNGLELITRRTVFDSGHGGCELVCSACATRFEPPDEWAKAVGEWHQQTGSANLPCPQCGHCQSILEWQHDPPWAFANLGFKFWNWPPLKKTFVDEFGKRLQHRVILVAGKL